MAIYYATTKPISRSSGRSATASAAYRAGAKIEDKRSGKTHDYSKRGGVEMAFAFDKNMKKIDRSELWNKAELAENRKDGRTAREWVLAIPHELIPKDKNKCKDFKQNEGAKVAIRFAKVLAERYNVAVDVAIHTPDKQGDNRNYHAHIMTTTREFSRTDDGIELGDKAAIELSNTKRKSLGLSSSTVEIKELRKEWENIVNTQLERLGIDDRIDHRTLRQQGIEQKPTIKMGWKASAMERRGIETDKGDINRAINADNLKIKDLALEIRVDKYKLEEQKQALEFQQGMDALRAKQDAITAQQQAVEREKAQIKAQADAQAQADAEKARPKTAEEYVAMLSKEERQKVKEIISNTISQYSADINSKAVELYEKATPPNRRAEPLFSHYSYSDMKEVQPYKALAQRQIHEKEPSRYKDYSNAVDVTNAIRDAETRESCQKQAERIRQPSRSKGIDR